MKRIVILYLAVFCVLGSGAQQRRSAQKAQPKTTKVVKKKPATKGKKAPAVKAKRPSSTAAAYASVRKLQSQRAEIQKKIKQQERALRANQADVKQRLQNLMVINSEIDERQKSIDGIQKDIHQIDGNIGILKSQLQTLEQQLTDRKTKYIQSMRYMARHRSVQDKMMFVFSAKNFTEMYRRLRFVREYAAFQRAQGEIVKAKQLQVNDKHKQLETVKGYKNNLLYKDKREHAALQTKQDEQKKVVQNLQNQQRTIQAIIAEQRKKDAALNAIIDRMVVEEVAKARARAAAEAKRKAEAAEAARRRAQELARKKAAAEAAARENQRRIAEAKAREAQLKAEARAAAQAEENARKARLAAAEKAKKEAADNEARAAAERKARTELAAREAEAARLAAERKAMAEQERNNRAIAEAKKNAEEARRLSTVDRMMSGGFEANKGRLPMPITGSYRVVSHFGQYNVEGLKNVTLDNKGINILGQSGCMARSIYDGEVSGIYGYSGTYVVMVRHGAYISVYCNLKSVSVSKGQRVSTRQSLGAVGTDNILQFQLRREAAKLNPEVWLGR